MTQTALKVAVQVCDPSALPRWIVRLLKEITESDELDCCALLTGRIHKKARTPWPIRAWLGIEARCAARSPPPVSRFSEIPCFSCGQGEEISALSLDVILDLSGSLGRGIDPYLSRHGVWFSDCVSAEPGLAGFRSLLRCEHANPLSLFRRTDIGGRIQTIAGGAVNPKYLASRNELFLQEKSVVLILRELRRLALTGVVAEAEYPQFEGFSSPGFRQFVNYLVGIARESGRRLIERLLARTGFRPGMFQINSLQGDLPDFDPTHGCPNEPTSNAYQADPFLWHHQGLEYCFFETFDYRNGRGHISVGRLEEKRLTDIRTALRTDYHLSFPFLFEHDGNLFMMPECCAMKRIEVWRCTDFPDRWELHSIAMEGVVAADSSLAEIDGQWWLFTNISTDPFGDVNTELHLFQVDVPNLRTIVPHPLNPVRFDARYARNGGRIIPHGGKYFRPAQENSHGTYGYGLNLMRIDALSMENYSEALVRRIRPDFSPGLIGCHHLDARGDLIVFDSRRLLGGRHRNPSKAGPVA